MIPLDLFDYSKHRLIYTKVMKYVNYNLSSIVRVVFRYAKYQKLGSDSIC